MEKVFHFTFDLYKFLVTYSINSVVYIFNIIISWRDLKKVLYHPVFLNKTPLNSNIKQLGSRKRLINTKRSIIGLKLFHKFKGLINFVFCLRGNAHHKITSPMNINLP